MSTEHSDTIEVNEPLEKKCPRCGKPSNNKSNPSGRCASCLKKLASNKKKVGHYLHEHKVADDALRRQSGKNGTAKKKKSGLGSRKQIIKQTHEAEKKAGQVLSPDRKDNSKGYSAKNVRMVPKELNRGRHHVDPKKLRTWKKRLKKHDLDTASLYTLMKAKFQDDENILELLKSLGPDGLETYIDTFDELPLEESGLEKGAMRRLAPNPKSNLTSEDDLFPKNAKELAKYPRKIDPSEQKRTQVAAIKYFNSRPNPQEHLSHRKNSETGKNELHVKLHRGMVYDEQEAERDYGPDWKDYRFSVEGNKVGHKGEGWWTNEEAARTYGDLHSAWVPISHISAIGSRMPGQTKDEDKFTRDMRDFATSSADPDHMHFIVKPGMYDYAQPVQPKNIKN